MHDQRSSGPPAWPSYQVFKPDDRLRRKALVPGSPKEAVSLASRKAREAVDLLAGQFPLWMQEEAERLGQARDALSRDGVNRERLDRLFTAAHDIRGQASTYGYPAAADIAGLLCTLIELSPDPMRIPAMVVDQHVDAILAVVRENARGKDHPATVSLIGALQILNERSLQRQFRAADEEGAAS
jgi:chemotaxis protein histidine kinase CheA